MEWNIHWQLKETQATASRENISKHNKHVFINEKW